MNRYKEVFRDKGYKLNDDYPYLPIDEDGLTLEDVAVKFCPGMKRVVMVRFYTSLVVELFMDKDGTVKEWKRRDYTEEDPEVEDDDMPFEYTPSATMRDYSPSNPWDAPGMSIHDFI